LPTRSSLRGTQPPAPAPAAEAKSEPKSQPAGERVIPGASEEQPASAWEERLGPLGIGISALVACGLVYAVAVWLQLF
jgi:hypothetical protein